MARLLIVLMFASNTIGFAQSDAKPETRDSIEIADRLIQEFQFEKAINFLSNKKDTVNIEVLSRRGHCYFRLGNYSAAIAHYKRILDADSMHRSSLFQLAQLYGRNNQFAESEKCFHKLIELDSTNSFYHKQYGTLAGQAGDVITSIIEFQLATAYNPRDIESYIQLGNILLDSEQYWLADSILSEAAFRLKSPQLKLLLAKAQLEAEKYQACIETTLSLMKRDTVPAYARLLGISYFQLEEYDKVIPWMQFLLDRNIGAEWVYYFMGVSFREMNEPDTAVYYLTRAVEKGISENIHSYYSQLANAYESKNDHKNAIKYYKAAYETSKSNILLYHLARNYDVYYKDKSTAIAYYKRYLNSDDTIKMAKDYTRYRLDELEVYR